MYGSGTGRLKGKQVFVCKRDYASFVDIETVIQEKDFDQDPEKDTSPCELIRPGSMDYDPGRLSGRISFKKNPYSLCEGFVGLNPLHAANSTFRIFFYVDLN